MDIRKKAVNTTGTLHLRDASEKLMYQEKTLPDGKIVDDKDRPVRVNLYGPGSKQYARATTWQSNQFMNRVKKRGKTEQTPEERAEENATFLGMCTQSWENMEYGEATSDDATTPEKQTALSMAIYQDQEIGFVADQVAGYIKEWSNFLKDSPTI